MNRETIDRTQRLGGILKELYSKAPDHKIISLLILQDLGLEGLGQVLQARRQDWTSISETLQARLQSDPGFQRCLQIIEAVRKHPNRDYQALNAMTGYNPTTIQQTLNALERGGVRFDTIPAETKNGRPRVLRSLKKRQGE